MSGNNGYPIGIEEQAVPVSIPVLGDDEKRVGMTGDEAATLMGELHRVGESKGFARVRIDRGQHPEGHYYEIGYSLGEVNVRFSHSPTLVLLRADPKSALEFGKALAANARSWKKAAK